MCIILVLFEHESTEKNCVFPMQRMPDKLPNPWVSRLNCVVHYRFSVIYCNSAIRYNPYTTLKRTAAGGGHDGICLRDY